MVTEANILQVLRGINDPHIPVSLERMGMVRGATVSEGGAVTVKLTIPCLGCPGTFVLKSEITEALMALNGVNSVRVDYGWHHDWSRDKIDPEARQLMSDHGIYV